MEREDSSPLAVYDFLYRDRYRIESYYAQIFGGRTLSLEKASSTVKGRTWNAKVNAGAFSIDRQSPEEISESSRRVIDPHDMATIDVLEWLVQNDYITDSLDTAKEGHLVRLRGSLLLADRRVMVSAAKALGNQGGGSKTARNMKMGAELFGSYPMPSMFALRCADDKLFAGTLSEDASMEFVLSSHTWKFGTHGLRDVYAIGMLESVDDERGDGLEPLEPVLNISRTLHGWFPTTASRITPIVMYRRLVSTIGVPTED